MLMLEGARIRSCTFWDDCRRCPICSSWYVTHDSRRWKAAFDVVVALVLHYSRAGMVVAV